MDSALPLSQLAVMAAGLLLALAFLLEDLFKLRLLAAAGFAILLVVLLATGHLPEPHWLALAVLLGVNLFGLAVLAQQRAKRALPATDKVALRRAFAGLDDNQIAGLVAIADKLSVAAGETITRHDAPVGNLFVILSGAARVDIDGSVVAILGAGSFIGEIAYLTGTLATAQVTAEQPTRLLSFSHTRLARRAAEEPEFNATLHQLLGRDLAQKIQQANAALAVHPVS